MDIFVSAFVSGEMMADASRQSFGSLIGIYAALMGLLVATVLGSHLPLGAFSLVVALLIALAKAILVILFFMHVKFASRVTRIFVACGFLWLGILFTLTFSDYLTRTWGARADDISRRSSPIMPPPGVTAQNPRPNPIDFRPSPYQR